MALESGVLVARAKVSGASRAQWKRVRSGFFGAAGAWGGAGGRGAGFSNERGHCALSATVQLLLLSLCLSSGGNLWLMGWE